MRPAAVTHAAGCSAWALSTVLSFRRISRKCPCIMAVLLTLSAPYACSTTAPASSPLHIPRDERAALAVLNLKNATTKDRADQFQPWEYGIATMLTTDLEALGVFNVVERERLMDITRELDLQKTDLVDRDTAVAVGKMTAARYILTGSFAEMGGQLRIAVQIFSVEKGIQLGASSMTGKTDEFFSLEKKLFVKVIESLEVVVSQDSRERIMNSVETHSVDASLKNYSGEMTMAQADALKKAGRSDEALKLLAQAKKDFTEALAYDPDYMRAKNNLTALMMAIPITL